MAEIGDGIVEWSAPGREKLIVVSGADGVSSDFGCTGAMECIAKLVGDVAVGSSMDHKYGTGQTLHFFEVVEGMLENQIQERYGDYRVEMI